MIIPRVLFVGDPAAATPWVGLAKKLARECYDLKIASKVYRVGVGTTIRVENVFPVNVGLWQGFEQQFGGISKVWIDAGELNPFIYQFVYPSSITQYVNTGGLVPSLLGSAVSIEIPSVTETGVEFNLDRVKTQKSTLEKIGDIDPLPANELYKLGKFKHYRQSQQISEPVWYNNVIEDGAIKEKNRIMFSWSSRQGQIAGAGAFMPTAMFSETDIAYDLSPTKMVSGDPIEKLRMPDADWPHDACMVKITHAEYGTRQFIILVDASSVFYCWPTIYDENDVINGDPLYASQDIKTNVFGDKVQSIAAPFPEWGYKPNQSFRDQYIENAYSVYLEPRYVWRFNADGNKVVGLILERVDSGMVFTGPDVNTNYNKHKDFDDLKIYAYHKLGLLEDNTEFDSKIDTPGWVELSISISLTGNNPEDFEFDLTLSDSEKSDTTLLIAADYIQPIYNGWDTRCSSVSVGDLVVAEIELRTNEIAMERRNLQMGYADSYEQYIRQAWFIVKNITQSSTVVSILIYDSLSDRTDWGRPFQRESYDYNYLFGKITSLELSILSWTIQYELRHFYLGESDLGTGEGFRPFCATNRRVYPYKYDTGTDYSLIVTSYELHDPFWTPILITQNGTGISDFPPPVINAKGQFVEICTGVQQTIAFNTTTRYKYGADLELWETLDNLVSVGDFFGRDTTDRLWMRDWNEIFDAAAQWLCTEANGYFYTGAQQQGVYHGFLDWVPNDSDGIPPISLEEFTDRFTECYDPETYYIDWWNRVATIVDNGDNTFSVSWIYEEGYKGYGFNTSFFDPCNGAINPEFPYYYAVYLNPDALPNNREYQLAKTYIYTKQLRQYLVNILRYYRQTIPPFEVATRYYWNDEVSNKFFYRTGVFSFINSSPDYTYSLADIFEYMHECCKDQNFSGVYPDFDHEYELNYYIPALYDAYINCWLKCYNRQYKPIYKQTDQDVTSYLEINFDRIWLMELSRLNNIQNPDYSSVKYPTSSINSLWIDNAPVGAIFYQELWTKFVQLDIPGNLVVHPRTGFCAGAKSVLYTTDPMLCWITYFTDIGNLETGVNDKYNIQYPSIYMFPMNYENYAYPVMDINVIIPEISPLSFSWIDYIKHIDYPNSVSHLDLYNSAYNKTDSINDFSPTCEAPEQEEYYGFSYTLSKEYKIDSVSYTDTEVLYYPQSIEFTVNAINPYRPRPNGSALFY